jgi:hypothetical protein
MDRILLIPIGIVAWGVVEFTWAVLDAALPRYLVAQGLCFVALGLAFVVMAAMPHGVYRTSLGWVFVVSAIWAAIVQYRLMRAERGNAEGQEG